MDPELRRKCEQTLGADPDWMSLRPRSTYKPFMAMSQLLLTPPNDLLYEELGEIGRGGMGIVSRARQISLDREVAIKKVRLDGLNDLEELCNASQDFLAEAFLSGALEHPNIPPIYDLLTTARGDLYMSMKLVDGVPWGHLLTEHPADLVRHLEILRQVCNAVAYAHSRDIVHNDLKPENIMVGTFGEVLVMDWGLAVDVGPPRENSRIRHKSSIQSFCGTPCYMPPELAEGRGEDVGPWTDVYLLGGVLYEILSGLPPHPGEDFELVVSQAAAGHVPEFDHSWPDDLVRLAQSALDPDPARRLASASAFQDELSAYMLHRESLEISFGTAEVLEQCHMRLEAFRASSALARDSAEQNALYEDLAEAIAGFSQARRLWDENPRAREGEIEARVLFAEAAFLQGDLGLAETQIARLGPAEEASELRSRVVQARRRERREKRSRHLLQYGLLAAIVAIVTGLAASTAVFNEQHMMLESEKNTVEQQNIQIRKINHMLLAQQREVAEARDKAETARSAAELRSTIAQEALDSIAEEASSHLVQGDEPSRALAVRILDVAIDGWGDLKAADEAEGRASLDASVTLYRFGQLALGDEDGLDEAETAFERALAICRRHFDGPEEIEAKRHAAMVLASLGEVARRRASPDHARQAFLESVAILRQLIAGGDRSVESLQRLAGVLNQLGAHFFEQKQWKEAQAIYEESVAIQSDILELGSINLTRLVSQLGITPELFSDPLAFCLTMLEHGKSGRPRDLLVALTSLGLTLEEQGDLVGAISMYQSAVRIERQLLAVDPTSERVQGDLFDALGRLVRVLRRSDKAEEALRAAVERVTLGATRILLRQGDSALRLRLARAWVERGELECALGNVEAAIESAARAGLDLGLLLELAADKRPTFEVLERELGELRSKLPHP